MIGGLKGWRTAVQGQASSFFRDEGTDGDTASDVTTENELW
jgi:hypothetical protein